MKFNGIQTDRLEDFARRLLGIRQGGIVPTLSPEAALEIGLPQTLDAFALAGAWPWGSGGFYAAVAGEFAALNATNGSPNLLVTLQFAVSMGATSLVTLVRGTKTLDGAGPISILDQGGIDYRDTRRTRGNFPTLALGFQFATALTASVTGLNVIGRGASVGSSTLVLPEVVLAPGESVSLIAGTANSSLTWQATGTIRAANPDELAAS